MFCSKCGAQIQDGGAFCLKCGTLISANSSGYAGYGMQSGSDQTYTGNPVKAAKNINVARLVASALLVIGCFMPYVSAFGFSVTLFSEGKGDGKIFIGLAVLTIIFDLVKLSIPAFITSLVTLGLVAYETVKTLDAAQDAFGLIKYEAGFYLIIIGAIAMVLAGPIMKAIKRN